jgi:hypothetical protein
LVHTLAILFALAALTLSGCVRIKSDFRPGISREPVPGEILPPRLSVLSMTDPKATLQFQGDIDTYLSAAAWRWTNRKPAVRLLVPKSLPVKLKIDVTLAPAVFEATGPLAVPVTVGGRLFDTIRFDAPSRVEFAREVPAGWLQPGGATEIGLTVERGLTDPHTQRFYGLQLSRVALEP